MEIQTRQCSTCGVARPATREFFYWSKRDETWQSSCIPCRNQKARESSGAKTHHQDVWDAVAETGTRTCTLCGVSKPLAAFPKSKNCVQGRTKQCKICGHARRQRGRAVYVEENWAQVLLTGLMGRVAKHDYPFDLTRDYIESLWEGQCGRCYWFKVPLLRTSEAWHCQKPSLDRLVPELGYTKHNVVLSCLAANLGRNVTKYEEFHNFILVVQAGLRKS